MSAQQPEFYVYPRTIQPLPPAEPHLVPKKLNPLAPLAILFGIYLVVTTYQSQELASGDRQLRLAVGFTFAIGGLIYSLLQNNKMTVSKTPDPSRQAAERAHNEAERSASEEAQKLAQAARGAYFDTLSVSEKLGPALSQCQRSLELARREFSESAFSPFWDAIESAASALNDYRTSIDELGRLERNYQNSLAGRRHTFPPFPADLESIPDPSPALSEMRTLVRLAQTNYHFSAIWEQRCTRKVLIEGFRNLADVVDNIGDRISGSVDGLGKAVISGLTSLAAARADQHEELSAQARRQEVLLERIRASLGR